MALVNELSDGSKSQVARMAAGLQLKNQLTSKDPTVRMQYQQRWIGLDEAIKTHVKTMVRKCNESLLSIFIINFNVKFRLSMNLAFRSFQAIQTLGTEKARPSIAPQVSVSVCFPQITLNQLLIHKIQCSLLQTPKNNVTCEQCILFLKKHFIKVFFKLLGL